MSRSRTTQRAVAVIVVAAIVIAVAIVFRPGEALPDFTAYEAGDARKTAFFDYLRPMVFEANAALAADRERLLGMADEKTLGRAHRRWLERTAARFELDYDQERPRASIDSYLMTLNTHPAYQGLRAIRSQSRAQQQALSGLQLATGLSRYSERGQVYVDEIQSLIRFNALE